MGWMPMDLYTKILDDYASLLSVHNKSGEITFCNMSEPFMDGRIVEITRLAIERNLTVFFSSNATYFLYLSLFSNQFMLTVI